MQRSGRGGNRQLVVYESRERWKAYLGYPSFRIYVYMKCENVNSTRQLDGLTVFDENDKTAQSRHYDPQINRRGNSFGKFGIVSTCEKRNTRVAR